MRKSRLSKYVLYYHEGLKEDMGFTASFKPVLISFKRIGDLSNLRRGWYLVYRKPNKEKLMIGLEDIEVLNLRDLLWLGVRMRMRFFKITRKYGRVDNDMRVVKPRGIPPVDGVVGVLVLKPGGVIDFKKLSWTQTLVEVKGAEKVLVSRNKELVLVIVTKDT